jgi:hypothetical protein
MRRRIRSLAQSAGPGATRTAATSPGRGGPATHPLAPDARRRADQADPAHRPGGDTFEWDMRRSDGPTDAAFYDCGCGYKFTARVATTVRCPHCGTGQAW